MRDRIFICEALAKRSAIDPFFNWMVTEDEKCLIYVNIVRKRSWSKHGEAAQTVAKPGSDKKLGSRKDCENRLLEFFAKKGQDFYERGNLKLPLKWQQIMHENASEKMFEIAAIGMYARTTPTRHGLVDMFENTGRFTDRAAMDINSTKSISELMGVSSTVTLKDTCSTRF
ncbi:histone-lysine N-methyltransferase SETMAR-like [Trichonephila clavipes]|nr:histone-lysine N-methyltransferase SETMAR-like [Trichonephila clavipes]